MDVVVNCWEERVIAAVDSRCGSGRARRSIGKEAGHVLATTSSENSIKWVLMSETAKNFTCVLVQEWKFLETHQYLKFIF